MCQLDLEKAEEPEIKLSTSIGSWKRQENSRKLLDCFIDCAKAFDSVDFNKLWKILKNMIIPEYFNLVIYTEELLFLPIPGKFAASLVTQLGKNLPAMQETLVRFLCQEDLLEKG